MNEALLEHVARKVEKVRVEFQAPKDLVERVESDAERRGMGLSAYIRQALTLFVEASEAESAAKRRRPKS